MRSFLKVFICLQLLTVMGWAQSPVILTEGKILFERKVNAYSLMNEMSDKGGLTKEKVEAYKSSNPAFRVNQFTLVFKNGQTLYQGAPGDNTTAVSTDEWFIMVGGDNVVFTDLNSQMMAAEKHVCSNSFVVADSIRRIAWKITSEVRNIAGFQCRRANALIMDSVYVVAFYTTEIPTAGGPESFCGLPGMILGLALPDEHVTWFAKEVYSSGQDISYTPKKAITQQQFADKVRDMTKGWGPIAPLVARKAAL
ncbi:GLPGLI family protein [Chitinophaga sp. Cy-1792]|uniref:GLPGLI family protein n=1 Tax=Chitinophaga sp. Cy-1792 TaxID=2608339 RepID=UPI0014231F52|nr:GLPGLI family protein [Chitinophaga sp. Cy-1792]NIG53846.1 GLPGLI family protein [Chitinophaga sp. Cy-1792]